MNARERKTPPRHLALYAALASVLLIVVTMCATLAVTVGSDERGIVQGSEIDRAGMQRRLAERIALDALRLEVESDATDTAAELGEVVDLLGRIRTGMLDGDDELGLDGDVPAAVEQLYSPGGLDLTARLDAYERAARSIARGEGTDADRAAIDAEVEGQRLVRDLDVVVAALSDVAADGREDDLLLVEIGMAAMLAVGAISLVSLWQAIKRSRAQTHEGEQLAADLCESERLLRETVDALADAVVIQDEHGTVLRANRAAQEILRRHLQGQQLAPGDHFRSTLPSMFGPDGRPLRPEERPVQRALAADGVVDGVIGTTLDDGDHWFRWNATTVDDARGDRRLVVLTFSEITSERRLLADLDRERERFRLAFENAPIGKAVVAADGTFTEVNPAICEMFASGRSELLRTTFQELTHPDDIDADLALLQELIEGRADSYRLEKRFLGPDGEVIHALLSVAAVRPADGDIYFISQIVDIGDRKQVEQSNLLALEREREAVARLRELDLSKTQFVSTVSHELRTPLTSIMGYVELLADDALGPLTDGQRDSLGTVERNVNRLLVLIEDLLTMSSLDLGHVGVSHDPISVDDLVEGVIEEMMPIGRRNDVALFGPDEATGALVEGDRDQLERVLVNLTNNAIKFTPGGGAVRFEVDVAESEIAVHVLDTGVGIPDEEQSKVFDRFFRAASAHHSAVPGSGLGLAIAAELVELHGGTISLRSDVGVGTDVTVRLPIADSTGCDAVRRRLLPAQR